VRVNATRVWNRLGMTTPHKRTEDYATLKPHTTGGILCAESNYTGVDGHTRASYGPHISEATRMNRSAYEQRLMSHKTTNLVQSVLLLGGMTLLLALLGWLIAGGAGTSCRRRWCDHCGP
jgi:hypothetical protein